MNKQAEFTLQPGLIVNQEFFDYPAMQESAKNWQFLLKYRFDTGKFYGRHDGIQLNNMQFGHADRHEGMFFKGVAPKDCLTIALLQHSTGTVCINKLKMYKGDIIIIDNSEVYDFSSSHHSVLAILSIHKSLFIDDLSNLLYATNKKFKDKNNILSLMIEKEWQKVMDNPERYQYNEKRNSLEMKVLDTIKTIFKNQVAEESYLTDGEIISLEIKEFLLETLRENISIENIVTKYQISDKTLQNSFKSLFGITPKRFITLLKLNHAHEDLLLLNQKEINISDISLKWGFSHFGRFSQKYKLLFGVLPSETLKKRLIQSSYSLI